MAWQDMCVNESYLNSPSKLYGLMISCIKQMAWQDMRVNESYRNSPSRLYWLMISCILMHCSFSSWSVVSSGLTTPRVITGSQTVRVQCNWPDCVKLITVSSKKLMHSCKPKGKLMHLPLSLSVNAKSTLYSYSLCWNICVHSFQRGSS